MPKTLLHLALVTCFLFSGCRTSGTGVDIEHVRRNDAPRGPRILCVVAHPDDEIAFAGTIFKNSKLLDGATDIVVVTNGEGGFKYATLAEEIYDRELSDEGVGREHLPAIRKQEFLRGAELLHVRNAYFLGQKDHRYTTDPNEVIDTRVGVWDLVFVKQSLREILLEGDYDFVLTLAPLPTTHGHHKAATILALDTVRDLPSEQRPTIMCVRASSAEETELPAFSGLSNFPVTRIKTELPPFIFDRLQGFGHRDRLNYKIIASWAAAEHKSQGTMQLGLNETDREYYYLFEVNSPTAIDRARNFFRALEGDPFPERDYGPSAGTNAGN